MTTTWGVFTGTSEPHDGISALPPPPPWRLAPPRENKAVSDGVEDRPGGTYRAGPPEIEAVNAALYLRRPLLVTGPPGVGKSSLADAVTRELKLGEVLRWPITTRSTLQEGLYAYDAIGRLQDINIQKLTSDASVDLSAIGKYIRLGPLGTALLPSRTPRVLLMDEIDKSDIDLPNDLLHVFEEGQFTISELARIAAKEPEVEVLTWDSQPARIVQGRVIRDAFPLVILTSNGERDFPAAFLRRCIRLTIKQPDRAQLEQIVAAHLDTWFPAELRPTVDMLITEFLQRRTQAGGNLATDQLLNAIYLASQPVGVQTHADLLDMLMQSLTS